jgi:catechol 2,3-dioxygenase-like lactoylglutathione lyase family enzyme
MMTLHRLTLLVRDYDEAIAFYVEKLGFLKTADDNWGDGFRWVTVAPHSGALELVLSLASDPTLAALVGKQAGYLPLFALQTDNCWLSYEQLKQNGIRFNNEPRETFYGVETSFTDIYGNIISLIEPVKS